MPRGIRMSWGTRSLLSAVVLGALLGVVAVTAAHPVDSAGVEASATVNETTIDVAFVGTVADDGTATVEVSGVFDNGQPVTDAEATVTIGGEPVTTTTITGGTATAELDPSVLDLEPTESAAVGLQGYAVENPATVAVVHEVFELDAGYSRWSVPQGAALSVEGVGAVTAWNATADTYDTVTDPVFETNRSLHRGLYLASDGDARLGYTFDTGTGDRGVVDLDQGWNFVGSNFDISAANNRTVADDLGLVQGDAEGLDIFTANFSRELDGGDTVGAYEPYWVFVGSDDGPVVRDVVGADYDRESREEVLRTAEGELTFDDQATAASTVTGAGPSTPAVVVESVEATTDSAVVVTYEEGEDLVVAGLSTFAAGTLDGGPVTVPVEAFGGFPGNHTAHIVPVADLSGTYTPGDTLSIATADRVLDSERATVFRSTLSLDPQAASDPIAGGERLATLATADLLDGAANETAFTVDVHPTDGNGTLVGTEFVGSSDVLTGANENVEVTAERVPDDGTFNEFPLNESDEYVAMVHLVDDGAGPGDPASPGEYPALPNADATAGALAGGVTDGGTVDPTGGTITGTVTDAGGSPVEAATVQVFAFGPDGPLLGSAETNATGTYSLPVLPAGEHLVSVSVGGTVVDETPATVVSNETATVGFSLDLPPFAVDIQGAVGGVAGETQAVDIAVENTGSQSETQTVTLDWGEGTYTNSTTVSLDGGEETVVTLSVTTDPTQALGRYNVTVTGEADTDTATATVGPTRSLDRTTVDPGGTVTVTVSGQVGDPVAVAFADRWSPPANDSTVVSTSFARADESGDENGTTVSSDGTVTPGTLEIVYEVTVPATVDAGTVYEWDPVAGGAGSALDVGGDTVPVFGAGSFETGGVSTVDSVLLDSVSSLLDETGDPLTDDPITAIEAEPSASNTDADNNGDAVSYPADTDIPVLAVDGDVVGVTGPFVTTDTDFASYGNEEVLLNLYDELLGGSGMVLHDEGHGQFYTLTPNGGDDFQAFAGYAENNSYTYDSTTDIEADLGSADAVVITTPSEAFTQSELDALSAFVDDGGVVFLHDQSDFMDFDATANHNEIASALGAGFRFNDDQVVDDTNNAGAPFVPTTKNFDEAAFPALFADREGLGFELDVNESYQVDVTAVTDGDTVTVEFENGTTDTVRIVGLDTAETDSSIERLQEYEGIDDGPALETKADEATTYAQNQLGNETVTLSFDPSEGLRGDFGRLLGFLELPDGTVYNEAAIGEGWARVYDSGFDRHDQYWELEQQARANGSGLWEISDPAATPEVRDDPVEELFFPQPVAVTGPETPVSSEAGEPLVALDRAANVAAIGGPLVEERFEGGEGGPGIDQYEVFPFLTNVIDAVGNATGPVVVDGGHGQFGADFAVSAEDTAYYMRYLEGQSPGSEAFVGLDGVVDLASDAGPDLVENGSAAARAVLVSTPTSELSPAERTAVTEFADAGGAVILVGSAADTGALANFDPLLNDLGADVGFTETSVTDPTNNLGGDSSVPTTSNFEEATFPELFTAYTPTPSGANNSESAATTVRAGG